MWQQKDYKIEKVIKMNFFSQPKTPPFTLHSLGFRKVVRKIIFFHLIVL